jgi:hypothetical protein
MTIQERTEVESRADRSLRRGDLSEALVLYRALSAAFPLDETLSRRLEQLDESLQPAELFNPKSRAASEPGGPGQSGPEQEGERLFALGDYMGAMSAYRRALEEKPGSDLIRERLVEIYGLARSAEPPADIGALLVALLDRIASRRRV